MTKVIASTVVLSESDMPRIRNSRNPWISPPEITLAMEFLATNCLVNNEETIKFIQEVEGPTKKVTSDQLEELVDILRTF